jgi:hypothetical protein
VGARGRNDPNKYAHVNKWIIKNKLRKRRVWDTAMNWEKGHKEKTNIYMSIYIILRKKKAVFTNTLNLKVQPPELWENKYTGKKNRWNCLSQSDWSNLLWQLSQTNRTWHWETHRTISIDVNTQIRKEYC